MEGIASIDLFVVPTIAFQQLFAFLVLGHKRRQLLWFAVTRNPTAEWLARQITEAFPWDTAPKYLNRGHPRQKERDMVKKLTVSIAAFAHILFAMQAAAESASVIKFVFVIAMENKDAKQIYGNLSRAPYINNSLIANYARATNFKDPLLELNSEPHYIWMEAGTNAFSDHTFRTDNDPSPKNSTASTDHLVTQIKNSGTVTWMTYQEDIKAGVCPVASSFPYAAKHNPFVFFKDVSGNPPSENNTFCIDHTKPYSSFAVDLAANKMANYVFITPNLCNDMHGDKNCPKVHPVTAGDKWLSSKLPRIIDWVNKNSGVIFIVWDEGSTKKTKENPIKKNEIPFLAIGPGVKAKYASSVEYDHGSLVRSIEEIFNLPILPAVSKTNNLADMFKADSFP